MNIRAAMRNKRTIDYYSLLEESVREGVHGTVLEEALKCIAYNSVMVSSLLTNVIGIFEFQINHLMKAQNRIKNSRKSIVKPVGFDLEAAKTIDELCYLPGHKALNLCSFMSDQMSTHWSCKEVESGVMTMVRETMEKVCSKIQKSFKKHFLSGRRIGSSFCILHGS